MTSDFFKANTGMLAGRLNELTALTQELSKSSAANPLELLSKKASA